MKKKQSKKELAKRNVIRVGADSFRELAKLLMSANDEALMTYSKEDGLVFYAVNSPHTILVKASMSFPKMTKRNEGEADNKYFMGIDITELHAVLKQTNKGTTVEMWETAKGYSLQATSTLCKGVKRIDDDENLLRIPAIPTNEPEIDGLNIDKSEFKDFFKVVGKSKWLGEQATFKYYNGSVNVSCENHNSTDTVDLDIDIEENQQELGKETTKPLVSVYALGLLNNAFKAVPGKTVKLGIGENFPLKISGGFTYTTGEWEIWIAPWIV